MFTPRKHLAVLPICRSGVSPCNCRVPENMSDRRIVGRLDGEHQQESVPHEPVFRGGDNRIGTILDSGAKNSLWSAPKNGWFAREPFTCESREMCSSLACWSPTIRADADYATRRYQGLSVAAQTFLIAE